MQGIRLDLVYKLLKSLKPNKHLKDSKTWMEFSDISESSIYKYKKILREAKLILVKGRGVSSSAKGKQLCSILDDIFKKKNI